MKKLESIWMEFEQKPEVKLSPTLFLTQPHIQKPKKTIEFYKYVYSQWRSTAFWIFFLVPILWQNREY